MTVTDEHAKNNILDRVRRMDPDQRRRLLALATPRIVEPYFAHIPHPKQQVFLSIRDREAMYGGSVGGGKSDALLMAALQYVDVPGYSALLLRRTWPDLNSPGAILDRARTWLTGTPAREKEGGRRWEFPTKDAEGNPAPPARVSFGYIQHDKDVLKFQSAEYQMCVEKMTPVLMADGTWKPISRVRVGEWVATLEGPRPVTAAHNVGMKPSARVTTAYGSVVVSRTHPMLTPFGWVSPQEQRAIRSRGVGRSSEACMGSSRERRRHAEFPAWGRQQAHVPTRPVLVGSRHLDSHASEADARIGFGESGGSRPADEPLREWSFPVVLYGPALRSVQPCSRVREHAQASVTCGCGVRGSVAGCLPCFGSGDGRSLQVRADVPVFLPSPDDAAPSSSESHIAGDPGCTHGHTRSDRMLYTHPYTKEVRQACADVHLDQARVSLEDDAYLWDLTVEGASHYVSWSGIIARNCGFDELTQFSEKQYTYMFSRIRRPQLVCLNCEVAVRKYGASGWRHAKSDKACDDLFPDPKVLVQYPAAPDGVSIFDVPLRMRAATNPGGPGHEWVRDRFIDPKTKEETAFFVPARLSDNPSLDRESYMENLQHLTNVDRERLIRGDWDITEEGDMFERHWFDFVDDYPRDARMGRFWDNAATAGDGDFTAGVKLAVKDGIWYVIDVVHGQWSSFQREKVIRTTAAADGRYTPVIMEQEPGSSGKDVIDHYRRNVLLGYNFVAEKVTGSKVDRAYPLASAAEAGNVRIVKAPWNKKYLDELTVFPNGNHDDMVDATSGCMNYLSMRQGRLLV